VRLFNVEGNMPGLSWAEFGLPVVLIGAVLVIAVAALTLHLLFPPVTSSQSQHTPAPYTPRRCPSCHHELEKVERYGVAVETCPGCHGVWLSQDKMEQIIG
jgi:hypothetical protein